MIKANNENVFVGAKVKYKNKEYYVAKVNQKSCYICDLNKKELEKENVILGETDRKIYNKFTDLMKSPRVNGKKVTYEELFIFEKEIGKKEEMDKIEEHKKKTKIKIPLVAERKILELLNNKRKGKPWMYRNTINKSDLIMLGANEEGICLIRYGEDKIFFDTNKRISSYFNEEIHKNGKEIIFPKILN